MSSTDRNRKLMTPALALSAAGLIALVGLSVPATEAMAQAAAQPAPTQTGTSVRLRVGPAGTPANVVAPRGGAAAPQPGTFVPLTGGAPQPGAPIGGTPSAFPQPRTLGRTPLRLPPPPAQIHPPVAQPPSAPIVVLPRRDRHRVIVVHQPVYPHHGYTYQHVQPQVQVQPLVPSAEVPQVEAEPLTGIDLAEAFLHWDEPERAITLYQEYLAENPENASVIRMLGLALIDAGRLQEGVASLSMAYDLDPNLARDPVLQDVFGPTEDLRRNLTRVSVYANRVNSASAWLTLAVLMQAEGRTRPASNMVERAERVELGEEIVTAMYAALGTPR